VLQSSYDLSRIIGGSEIWPTEIFYICQNSVLLSVRELEVRVHHCSITDNLKINSSELIICPRLHPYRGFVPGSH